MIWSCIYPNALISKYDIITINNLVRERERKKKREEIITTMHDGFIKTTIKKIEIE